MTTSPAQRRIIKSICKLQGQSVQRLCENTSDYKEEDKEYRAALEVTCKQLGITDLDIMAELSEITHEFDQLSVGDLEVEDLDEHSLRIFKYILTTMSYLWTDLYPNAYKSLTTRVTRKENEDKILGNNINGLDMLN